MKILLVDDDRDLVGLLRYALQLEGNTILSAYDGEAALRTFLAEAPDLVILDIMMPKRSGLEVLRDIRREAQVPVIMLTALNDEETAVSALRAGADDYVTKPFRLREFKARVEALQRRNRIWNRSDGKYSSIMSYGDVTLDPRGRSVTVGGQPINLTRTEFAMLQYLMINRDTVVSVGDIMANVWQYDANEGDDVVKVTVSRLRRKIEQDPSHPRYIFNVPGVGYVFKQKANSFDPLQLAPEES